MTDRDIIRHFLATLAFRFQHAIRGADDSFPQFDGGRDIRRPIEIANHVAYMLEVVDARFNGRELPAPVSRPWEECVEALHRALKVLDSTLGTADIPDRKLLTMFQGPLSDSMTHIGQLTLLRRLSGSPVRPVKFYESTIKAGQVGPDQPVEYAA